MCGGPRAPVDESKGQQQDLVRLGDIELDQPVPSSHHKAENVSLTRTLSGRKLYIVSSQVCLVASCDEYSFPWVCVLCVFPVAQLASLGKVATARVAILVD